MIIRSADFIVSAVQPKQFPKSHLPGFAFIGRSNVGKSSLINMISGRKLLAKTSGKPGKTRTLNFFVINDSWNLVDMPGYGYARASKTEREKFSEMIRSYLKNRLNLVYLFILIDSRHQPLASDLSFIETCAEMRLPFGLVFTKTDKCSKNELESNLSVYHKKLKTMFEEFPPLFPVSSVTGAGREDLLSFIDTQGKAWADTVADLVRKNN